MAAASAGATMLAAMRNPVVPAPFGALGIPNAL